MRALENLVVGASRVAEAPPVRSYTQTGFAVPDGRTVMLQV